MALLRWLAAPSTALLYRHSRSLPPTRAAAPTAPHLIPPAPRPPSGSQTGLRCRHTASCRWASCRCGSQRLSRQSSRARRFGGPPGQRRRGVERGGRRGACATAPAMSGHYRAYLFIHNPSSLSFLVPAAPHNTSLKTVLPKHPLLSVIPHACTRYPVQFVACIVHCDARLLFILALPLSACCNNAQRRCSLVLPRRAAAMAWRRGRCQCSDPSCCRTRTLASCRSRHGLARAASGLGGPAAAGGPAAGAASVPRFPRLAA